MYVGVRGGGVVRGMGGVLGYEAEDEVMLVVVE